MSDAKPGLVPAPCLPPGPSTKPVPTHRWNDGAESWTVAAAPMGNPASSQLSTGTPRLWCCEGSSSTHLLFPSYPSFSKTCVLNFQAGARGWNHGEAWVHHLGWPSPRKKQQGREGINLGLLPCTFLGQSHRRILGTVTQEHPIAQGLVHWHCKQAGISQAVRQGGNARGLHGPSPWMPPPPPYLEHSWLNLRNVTITVENQNKKAM